MPKQKRNKTDFKGVYFVELSNGVKSFFIRYKHNGRSFEERVGKNDDGWDAEKAHNLRKKKIFEKKNQNGEYFGKTNSNIKNKWFFTKIFERYLKLRPDLKARENDVYRFKNYIEPNFSEKTPSEVTVTDIHRFRNDMHDKGLKPATVRHALELLRRLSNFAAKKRYCRGLNFKIEMPKVENHKTEYLSEYQLNKLLDVLDEEPDIQARNLVRLALYSGMRRGELFALKWSDIDFDKKVIFIKSSTDSQYAKIPLNEMAEMVLSDHIFTKKSSEYVFPGRNGRKRTECKLPLIRIRKKAELPNDFRILQGLRHVFATNQVLSGKVDLDSLQSLLTLKSSLMTKRYAHLIKNQKKYEEKAKSYSGKNLYENTKQIYDQEEASSHEERYEDEEITSESFQESKFDRASISESDILGTSTDDTETEVLALDSQYEPKSEESFSKSEEFSKEEASSHEERYEDEEISNHSIQDDISVSSFDISSKKNDTSNINDFDLDELKRNTDYESSIEELTEYDGQLNLFDTFDPEENFNDNTKSPIPLEEIPIVKNNRNIITSEKTDKFFGESKQTADLKEVKILETNQTLNRDEFQDSNEMILKNEYSTERPSEEEVYNEAIDEVFGKKKELEIDSWAMQEAEAMSARAEAAAKLDENSFRKTTKIPENIEVKKEEEINDTSKILQTKSFGDSISKLDSSEQSEKEKYFYKEKNKKNSRPSMKEIKKDLKSLSELINSPIEKK